MRHTRSAFAVLVLLMSTSVDAQNTPDAGALMRQTEQLLRQRQIQQTTQKRDALPPAMVFNEATLVTVQHFKFNGNKILTTDQLQTVVTPFKGRPLNQHDLQQMTYAVSQAYRQIGWFVQVYIPKQDLTLDEMTLQVIESIPPSKPEQ